METFDTDLLQKELDTIFKWAGDNNEQSDASKFQALH